MTTLKLHGMRMGDLIRSCYAACPRHIAWMPGEAYGEFNIDDHNKTVKRVLFCVTPTQQVQVHFRKYKYDLLISHHPYQTRDIPQIILHTALDCCEGGLNDMWRDHIELKNTCQHFDGTLGWHGEVEPIQFSELLSKVKRLSGTISGETFNQKGMTDIIKTVVICSGLGGMVNDLALATEADCYILGQNIMAAKDTGFKAVIETGHTASEWIGVNFFKKVLAGVQVDLAPADLDVYGEEFYRERAYNARKTKGEL